MGEMVECAVCLEPEEPVNMHAVTMDSKSALICVDCWENLEME